MGPEGWYLTYPVYRLAILSSLSFLSPAVVSCNEVLSQRRGGV